MKRAQSIKAQWESHRQYQDVQGRSQQNFGRMSLGWYVDYCYTTYKDLCQYTGEATLSIGKWLTQDVKQ